MLNSFVHFETDATLPQVLGKVCLEHIRFLRRYFVLAFRMTANYRVSVGWQIIFTFIPFVNFLAFDRIGKLRKYLLYVIVPAIVTPIVVVASNYGENGIGAGSMASYLVALGNIYFMITLIGCCLQGFAIYLVIIWSRQHNKTIEFTTAPAG